jgi:Big-like domain-containing protein
MRSKLRTGTLIVNFILLASALMWTGCSSSSSSRLESIAVAPGTASVAKGLTQQFTATGTFTDGSTKDLTSSATWTSSDTGVAMISTSTGLATTLDTGSTTIQAAAQGIDGSTQLTVGPAEVVSIAVTPSNQSFPQGFPVQFVATGTFTDKTTQDVSRTVTWSSIQPTIASISAAGLAAGLGQGVATIQAALNSVQGTTNLTITSVTLTGLVVAPQNPAIADAGATQQFMATARLSDGTSMDATSTSMWSSSNSLAASVNGAGQATSATIAGGQSASFTSIQAALGNIKGVSILTVTNHSGNGFAGVFTQHNDIGRTGQNVHETILTPANVNTTTFGKVFTLPVDGNLYAQPLYVPNVKIAGKGTHNVIYAATEGDSVYAFDADNNTGANAAPLWQVSLLDAAHGAPTGARTISATGDVLCFVIDPQFGITSTPVIDPSAGTMYVEAESRENGIYVDRLHALDITTGLERSQSPTVIKGTVPGTGAGSSNGIITFNPVRHLNRPGLLLVNGIVYLAYGSRGCDAMPFHGWLFAYDGTTLAQQAVLNITPNGEDGAIWMSGAGVAADSTANLFLATGNGTFDTTNIPATQLGDSILKLTLNGNQLSLLDYFSPFNESTLDADDLDLGSGGVLLLPDQTGPHTHELVEAGKSFRTFVIDRDQMTANNLHNCLTNCDNEDSQIVQESTAAGVMFSGPAFWNNTVYLWGAGGLLKSFGVSNGLLTQSSQAPASTLIQFPGATVAISANGATNGIAWAVDATQNVPLKGLATGPSILYAFDASNLTNVLFISTQAANNRDAAGPSNKFVVPTIANGRVYFGTQTELDVYGLLPTNPAASPAK